MKYIFLLIFIFSCKNQPKQPEKVVEAVPEKRDTMNKMQDSIQQGQLALEEQKAVEQGLYKTYWGYRFRIKGDFNGDRKTEVLTEKIISGRNGQEIAKFCGFEEDSTADCDWTARVNRFRAPKCVLSSSDPKIADLLVTTSDHATIGLDYIVNLGDLNGDGTDEVYFVEDYGGCNSALREGIIATYKNKKWIVIQKIGDSLDYYPYLPDEVIKEALDLVKKSQETKQYEQELRAVEPLIIKKGKKNILQRV